MLSETVSPIRSAERICRRANSHPVLFIFIFIFTRSCTFTVVHDDGHADPTPIASSVITILAAVIATSVIVVTR